MKLLVPIMSVFLMVSGFRAPEPDEEVTIIIEVEQPVAEFVDELERTFPRLEVVARYDTLLNAAAVKGPVNELEKAARMETVRNQHAVTQYQTLATDEIPYSTHTLRNEMQTSYTGKGVKVGVIDTGVDYTHPDLTKNYQGGYDTVDFDDDPMETEGEGATIHGTHVAGVIAADGEMKGMAPDADLYAYRALGPGGMGTSVQVIAALEEAVEDGMDVINLSLGNDVNGPDWPTTHAVNKAVEMGAVVVAAAGNSGPDAWTVGSPATSSLAVTVGASSMKTEVPALKIPGEKQSINIQTLSGSVPWSLKKKYPVVYAGTGEKEMTDARGHIVLFERGGLPFFEKALKAYQAGAEAVLIYNHEEGSFSGGLNGSRIPIPAASLTKKEGLWLKEKAVEQNQWVETVMLPEDEQVAPFSSRGPVTTNWEVKPDLLAPGVAVWSTIPGGYTSLQGTSMAAPHIAGAAALLKEAHPDWTPKEIKSALVSTADVMEGKGESFLPTEQGAGVFNMKEALQPPLLFHQEDMVIGKVEGRLERKNLALTLENRTDEAVEVRFQQPERKQGETWELPLPFRLEGNETKEVSIGLGLNGSFLDDGVQEGYVSFQAGGVPYHVPYMYVNQKSTYEWVSGFEFTQRWPAGEKAEYRFHLSDPVDGIVIDLYRAGTMMWAATLVELGEQEAGMVEGEVSVKNQDLAGMYTAVVEIVHGGEKASYAFPVYIEGNR
ncbi:S8 family serine peptidase [Halobacillus sp. Cin3]|uniref:S8 family serine peptidase n=1 Tax=Halobacillus sp. Cin3 TaxID=2928441 RepID=UPI00248E59B2|nr:S8 family serine peptidase [Halobacillus sp. Cin3]